MEMNGRGSELSPKKKDIKRVSRLRLMNGDGVLTRTLKTMRDQEIMMKTAPRTKYAFHLCSDVPVLCSHMYFFSYSQRSMNHREQFSLSVAATSETVFRL